MIWNPRLTEKNKIPIAGRLKSENRLRIEDFCSRNVGWKEVLYPRIAQISSNLTVTAFL